MEHGQLLRSAPGSSLAWARAVLSRWRIGAAPQCAIISSAGNTRPLTAFRRCTLRGHGRQSRTQNVAGENRPSIALWGAGRGLATPRFSPGNQGVGSGFDTSVWRKDRFGPIARRRFARRCSGAQ